MRDAEGGTALFLLAGAPRDVKEGGRAAVA